MFGKKTTGTLCRLLNARRQPKEKTQAELDAEAIRRDMQSDSELNDVFLRLSFAISLLEEPEENPAFEVAVEERGKTPAFARV